MIVVVVAAVVQVLAAGAAHERAAAAAEAGAVALLQNADPKEAVERALGRAVDRAEFVIDRHHVTSRKPDDLPEFCRGILSLLVR